MTNDNERNEELTAAQIADRVRIDGRTGEKPEAEEPSAKDIVNQINL